MNKRIKNKRKKLLKVDYDIYPGSKIKFDK